MVFERKPPTPIDRAVADIEQQIADLERRARQTESPAAARPTDTRSAWTKWFAPPPRRPAFSPRRVPLDIPVEPMKELEQHPFPFERQPDLFNRPSTDASSGKLAEYLNVGGLKIRRPLKHVQRQNRQRFYLWLVLGIVALGLLWLVVH